MDNSGKCLGVLKKRKRYNKDEGRENMEAAIKAYENGSEMNVTVLASTYNVNRMSLSKRIKGPLTIESCAGRKPNLTEIEEEILVTYVKLMAKGGFGLTPGELRIFVESYMRHMGVRSVDIPLNKAWITGFLKKHDDLSKRIGRNLNVLRVQAMSRTKLDDFYELIDHAFGNFNPPPDAIWNADEAGFSCSVDSRTPIIAPRGFKNLVQIVPTDSHKYNTVHVCGSASGMLINPLVIFRANKLNEDWTQLKDFNYQANPSGWMTSIIFNHWLETDFYPSASHVLKEKYPSYAGPIYLFLDGHSSHTNLDVIRTAAFYNIVLLKLPSHSTHLLQPLDISFFAPLKKLWFNSLREWKNQNIGRKTPLSNAEFPHLLKQAFGSTDKQWLINGFKESGFFPFNPNAISGDKLEAAYNFPWDAQTEWQFFGGSETIQDRLESIESQHCEMFNYCVDSFKNLFAPPPSSQYPHVQQFSQEQRRKRGSGLAENLNVRLSSQQPSSVSTLEIIKVFSNVCVMCKTSISNGLSIQCALPACSFWYHTKCLPFLEDKTSEEISIIKSNGWICRLCETCRPQSVGEWRLATR